MSDMGVIGRSGIDRIEFFRKSEEILRYLNDIVKYGDPQEKDILSPASETLAGLVDRILNQYEPELKRMLESDFDEDED